MKDQEMIEIMSSALDIYGGFAIDEKKKALDKTITDKMEADDISMQRVREAIIINGEILEFDEEHNVIIALMNTGVMNVARAIVALKLSGESLHFAAYAKEGVIKQNLAQKAINMIKIDLSNTH